MVLQQLVVRLVIPADEDCLDILLRLLLLLLLLLMPLEERQHSLPLPDWEGKNRARAAATAGGKRPATASLFRTHCRPYKSSGTMAEYGMQTPPMQQSAIMVILMMMLWQSCCGLRMMGNKQVTGQKGPQQGSRIRPELSQLRSAIDKSARSAQRFSTETNLCRVGVSLPIHTNAWNLQYLLAARSADIVIYMLCN